MFARCLSALKNDRIEASKSLKGPENTKYTGNKTAFIEDIRQVYMCKLMLAFNDCGTLRVSELVFVFLPKHDFSIIVIYLGFVCV